MSDVIEIEDAELPKGWVLVELADLAVSTDTRLRREVVGQMLDYASNGVAYWSVEDIRSWFEQSCSERDLDPNEEIERFSDIGDPDDYWQAVKVNLQAGKMRLLFVADVIPTELRRVIEFLNEQMDPAEVLGVEIKQYQGKDNRTLVPKVVGATSGGEIKRSQVRSSRSSSSKEHFLESLEAKTSAHITALAKRIVDVMSPKVNEVLYSEGKRGAFGQFHHSSTKPPLFNINDKGQVGFPMRRLHKRAPFNDDKKRDEFRRKLETLPGFEMKEGGMEGFPRVELSALDDKDIDRLVEVLVWEVDQFDIGAESNG